MPSKNVWKKRTNIKIDNENKRKSCTQIKRWAAPFINLNETNVYQSCDIQYETY